MPRTLSRRGLLSAAASLPVGCTGTVGGGPPVGSAPSPSPELQATLHVSKTVATRHEGVWRMQELLVGIDLWGRNIR